MNSSSISVSGPIPCVARPAADHPLSESWGVNPRPAPCPPDAPGPPPNKPLPPPPKQTHRHQRSDSDELRRIALHNCAWAAEQARLSRERYDEEMAAILEDLSLSFILDD